MNEPNFGGGGGTGVSLMPVAFLVISPEGNVSVLPITNEKNDAFTALLEQAPAFFEKIKKTFASKKKKKDDAAAEAEAAETEEEESEDENE